MKSKSLIRSVLIILLCNQFAFSRLIQLSEKNEKSQVTIASFTENSSYKVSASNDVNDSRDTTQIFPARGGKVDWGLALSGGGVRSAAFSIGAMKSLYDMGILDKIDVISSVSGGSYASYWLFTQYDAAENKDNFGDTAFNNDIYINNICELQNLARSSALPNKYLLKIILNLNKSGAFNDYKAAIEQGFGNGKSETTKLDAFLDPGMNEDKVPYFIINTTLQLSDKDLDLRTLEKEKREISKRLKSVFEITPEFRGNPSIGFSNWTKDDKDSPTLSESITMSGAPKWKLKRSIKNPKPDVIKGEKLLLSDGGHSENLAALALIRRGIKNIIIIDAEQDPTYEFAAYRELKKMLSQINIKFNVPDIDNFLKNPKGSCYFYELEKGKQKKVCSPPSLKMGTATRDGENPIETNIYYVKMSQPKSIYSDKFSDIKAYKTGQVLSDERCQQRCNVNECSDDDICSCSNIKSDLINDNKAYENLYTYEVKRYSDFINYPSKNNSRFWTRTKIKFFNTVGKISPFFAYKFPHTTTVDQSFFSDQLEAFVGLGYLQTIELKKQIDQ